MMLIFLDLKCKYLKVKKNQKLIFFCTYPINLHWPNLPLIDCFSCQKHCYTQTMLKELSLFIKDFHIHILSSSSSSLLPLPLFLSLYLPLVLRQRPSRPSNKRAAYYKIIWPRPRANQITAAHCSPTSVIEVRSPPPYWKSLCHQRASHDNFYIIDHENTSVNIGTCFSQNTSFLKGIIFFFFFWMCHKKPERIADVGKTGF